MGGKQSKASDQKLFDSFISNNNNNNLQDLTGKVIAITGTSPGSLGYYIAKAAITRNPKLVLLLNRESERSVKAETFLKEEVKQQQLGATTTTTQTQIQTVPIDLLSFDSVREAARIVNDIVMANGGGLDVLCCNAGIMAQKDDRTVDGYNVEIQACHLSHYLLTKECYKSLEAAASSRNEARVIYHSSSARFGRNLEERYFVMSEPMTLGGNGSAAPWDRYHNAKLANSAFSIALGDKFKARASKVKSVGCEPGYATTGLQNSSPGMVGPMMYIMNTIKYLGGGQSPADGSLSAVMACFGPNVESGDFIAPTGRFGLVGLPGKTISNGVAVKKGGETSTLDPVNRDLIMKVTETALGPFFGKK